MFTITFIQQFIYTILTHTKKYSEILINDEFEDLIVKTLDDQVQEHSTDKGRRTSTNSKKSELTLEKISSTKNPNNSHKNPEKMAQNSKKEVPHEMKTQRSLSFESGGGGGQDPAWFTLSEVGRKNSIPQK